MNIKEVYTYYRQIVDNPFLAATMSTESKMLTLEYAKKQRDLELLSIHLQIKENPDFTYPEPDKKYEYWDTVNQGRYSNACKVISELERSLAPPVETSTPAGSIVEPYLLRLIFEKYGHHFEGETLDRWVQRFSDADINVPPIKVRADAREGSDRLILLAILSSIQTMTGNAFDFNEYVKNHFGIKAFDSAKSRNKEKRPFNEVVRTCDRILKVTTM